MGLQSRSVCVFGAYYSGSQTWARRRNLARCAYHALMAAASAYSF